MRSIFAGRTYRAEGNQVWTNAVEHKNKDGSTSISLGFGLLTVNEHLTNPEEVATEIATLLNAASLPQPSPALGAGEGGADAPDEGTNETTATRMVS